MNNEPKRFHIPAEHRELWGLYQQGFESGLSAPAILITDEDGQRLPEPPALCDMDVAVYEDVVLVKCRRDVTRPETWHDPIDALRSFLSTPDLQTLWEAAEGVNVQPDRLQTPGMKMLRDRLRRHLRPIAEGGLTKAG